MQSYFTGYFKMKTENFIKSIEEMKKKSGLDLSSAEDLTIGLMNLVSLEEHAFFSYMKTKESRFLDMLSVTRALRKKLLEKIVKKDDSEGWCMSKHLLASSMRVYEVGTKLLGDGKQKEAKEMFKDSAELYALFWKLNTGNGDIKIKADGKQDNSIFASVKKLLEC